MLARWILAAVTVLAWSVNSHAYIAVSANRLTLSEVMLEFPTVVVLTVEKFDSAKGAYLFKVTETLQGKVPAGPVRHVLLSDGKVPKRLELMKAGDTVVSFSGGPENRSIHLSGGGWYLTSSDHGWERLNQFRDDFNAMCIGAPEELAIAVRSLARGGDAVLLARPPGTPLAARMFVRFDAADPHRRWPAPDPSSKVQRTLADVGKALLDPNPGIRQQAAVEWGERAESGAASAPLLKALSDPHPEVRLAAAASLVKVPGKPDDVVPALIRALTDEDRFVCSFAAFALAGYGADARPALAKLAEALKDRNYDHDYRPHRAAAAAEAIVKIAPDSEQAKWAIALLVSDRMLNDFRSDSEGTRTAAARALGRCGPRVKTVLPKLIQRSKDEVPATRVAAAEATILVGAEGKDRDRAVAVLTSEMARGEITTRVQAIRACAASGCRELLPSLRKLLEDPSPDVRQTAERAVAILKEK